MELWFACKSSASGLCVEAGLFNSNHWHQFAAASRGVFHLLPVDSAMGGTKHCGHLGKSDVVVWPLKVASTIRDCEACGVMILFSLHCLPGAVRPSGNIVPAESIPKTKACFVCEVYTTSACLLPDVIS